MKNIMNNLQQNITEALKKKNILLVSHAVLGYPSFSVCQKAVAEMAKVRVEIIELQIPFSDPQADGSFFTQANQKSVADGTTVKQCFSFAEEVCAKYPSVNFVFMTYYNIAFKFGVTNFVKKASTIGIKGIIIPDLPIEESNEYIKSCDINNVAPILMVTPTTTAGRLKKISQLASGFLYCQARLGVTGTHTKFGRSEIDYIKKCRKYSKIPIAMGFGIQKKSDIDFLKGKVDIAICCTQAVRVLMEKGVKKMGEFLRGLRGNK